MTGVLRSFPVAIKMIVTDPVNLMLSIFPTMVALALYIFTISFTFRNSDRLVSYFRGYVFTADQANWIAKILTAILIIFIFFLMSWTFVVVVGIIAAPFNSLLSSRIEMKLVQKIYMDENQKKAIQQIKNNLAQTFKNELKKIIFIALVAGLAFLLNLFPLFYPIGIFLVATLLAVQFVDYSWSRYNMHFTACFKDLLTNIIPYSIGGFIFLLLIAIPIVNAFVPALATSYFTVLWLHRQNKISL